MTNPRLIATAVVSLAIGAAIGYKVAEKRLTEELITEFEDRLNRETNALRRMYKPDVESPQEMVQTLYGDSGQAAAEMMKQYAADGDSPREPVAYHKIRQSELEKAPSEETPVVTRKIFEPSDDRGEIYVISAEEHAQNEPGYEQVTWNYYAKDGVVTDVHEDRIEDYLNYLGPNALTSFGGDSGDENIVYVRNEVIMIDYEIVRSLGSYREEVLGEEMPADRPSQRMHNRGD